MSGIGQAVEIVVEELINKVDFRNGEWRLPHVNPLPVYFILQITLRLSPLSSCTAYVSLHTTVDQRNEAPYGVHN
jgi:hypothetical protein